MRPPARWIRSADIIIWAAATACRVATLPGRRNVIATGNAAIRPPRNTATGTCRWSALVLPAHVRGESQSAAEMPASHCTSMSHANIRSVRACTA